MKRNITAIVAAAVAAMAVSCTESVLPSNNLTSGTAAGTIAVSVNGLMGEYTSDDPESKASLVSNIRVSWEGDETVYVFDGASCLGSLTSSLQGDDDRIAVLSGSISATSASVLTLVYCPTLSAAPTVSDGKISIDLSEQNATATPFVVYGTLPFDGTAVTETIVPFTFATSVMKVNFTGFSKGTRIANAVVSDVNTACVLSLSGSAAPTVSGANQGAITRSGSNVFSLSGDGRGSFQIATVASASNTDRKLSITDSGCLVLGADFTSSSLAAGKSYNTVYALDVQSGYVDLGLPSGLLWATSNVGISDETPSGALFAWGETSPKTDYSWGTYKYCNGTEDYMTKYSSLASSGVYDFNEVLDASDDAAVAAFGNSWRTPTIEEFYELFEHTEYEFTTYEGINVVRLTSTVEGYEDASIFLPSDNWYWSSSATPDFGNDQLAFTLSVVHDFIANIDPSFDYRYTGKYIRPVYSEIVPAKSITIHNDVSVCVGATTYVKYSFSPADCTEKSVIWTVTDPEIASVGRSGKVFALKKGTTTVSARWADNASVSASFSLSVIDDPEPVAVDLGLESGTKWASFNLGAASAYECGALYAWGETAPRDEEMAEDYKWEDDDSKMTKYNEEDGLLELRPEDDAAAQRWGEGWSIPSKDDWKELVDNCTWSWNSVSNTFTAEGPNGNTIRFFNTVYDSDSMTYYYWSSTCYHNTYNNTWDFASCVDFYSNGNPRLDYGNRSIIRLVRPVYKTTD